MSGMTENEYFSNRGPDAPELNTPLLTKVIDHIEAHPEEHDQRYWGAKTDCGTAYCFAGHAVNMTMKPGWRFEWITAPLDSQALLCASAVIPDHGSGCLIGHSAMKVLGLTRKEAEVLFDPDNSVAALRAMVDELINIENKRLTDQA